MAFRKESILRQFSSAIEPALGPDERLVTGALTRSGPNPWLVEVVGFWIMLLLGARNYFIAVTDRQVILVRASMMAQRPKGIARVDGKSTIEITNVKSNRAWSRFTYRRSDGKSMRLNFARAWRDDMHAIVQSVGQREGAAQESAQS